jgi:ubiquinone/menaquinone biosynthesis C-methylase UbiE
LPTANDPVTSELRNAWEAAAPGWAKWEHVFDVSFSQATDALIAMAGISSGMRVLDVACGAGSQTIQAAKRAGPKGKLVASDISATMLEHVRQNAAQAGLENIETLECAADELPKTLTPFDAAICRMALMLFPSPLRALRAVQHMMKPGARFAALVFTTPSRSPFLAEPMSILLRHAGRPSPAPGGPGIFALGADGVLENLLKDGGFADVKTKIVKARLNLPSARDALHLMQEAAGAYRAVVADLSEEARSKAWDEVYDCLKQFESGDSFTTELEAIIASGARPG